MKLIKAYAENYGIIKDRQEFIFNDGITLIIGENGSGKSTILKLLKLCLFNEIDKTLDQEINDDANFFKVGVSFTHEGKIYQIDIHYDGTTNRKITVNNEIEYTGQEAIDYLKENFNPAIFMSGMFAMQNEISVISEKPSERRTSMQKVYDLEFKQEIADIELEIKKISDEDLKQIEKDIYALENIKYSYKETKNLPFDSTIKDKKEKEIKALKLQISDMENSIKNLETINNSLVQKESTSKDIQEEIDSILSDMSENTLSIKELQDNLANINIEEQIEHNRKVIQEEISKIEKQLQDKKTEFENCKLVRLSAWDNSSIDDISESIIETDSIIRNFEKQLFAWKKGECSECGTKFNHSEEDIQKLELKIKKSKERKHFLFSEKSTLTNEKRLHEKKIEENNQLKIEKSILKEQVSSIEEKLLNKKEEIIKSKNDLITKLESEMQNIKDKIKLLEKVNNDKNSSLKKRQLDSINIRQEIEKLKKSKSDITVDYSNYNLLIKELETLESDIDKYNSIMIENDIISKHNEELEKKEKEDKVKLQNSLEKRGLLIEEIDILSKSKIALQKELPSFILSEIMKDIEISMNKFIDKVYYKKLWVRMKEVRNAIQIKYSKRGKDVVKASGFEQQLMTLAYKDSLNKKANTGLMLLDEFDNNATGRNALKLYDVFGEMREIYNQLIIITHNDIAKDKLVNEYYADCIEMENGKIV